MEETVPSDIENNDVIYERIAYETIPDAQTYNTDDKILYGMWRNFEQKKARKQEGKRQQKQEKQKSEDLKRREKENEALINLALERTRVILVQDSSVDNV